MNETIEFSWWSSDEDGKGEKQIIIRKQDEGGFTASVLCEAFIDFMESAGFSVNNIYDYFG